ncbi:MAG TPA: TIGR02530 family flagellar biosynthesis protein [Solirubrobacteraceae bacterium]|nr:TIGR02530 family flagellar biosynthesis protein [Solirubrobacteraceae bacterium]
MSQVPHPALVPPGIAGGPAAIPSAPASGRTAPPPAGGPSFAEVLAQRTAGSEPPRFSRHALQRLEQRGIDLGGPTLARLTDGVARAAGKGARDSVVFVDNTAFVVSVANNTVITAVGSEHMREHVFTNIDSAVIA